MERVITSPNRGHRIGDKTIGTIIVMVPRTNTGRDLRCIHRATTNIDRDPLENHRALTTIIIGKKINRNKGYNVLIQIWFSPLQDGEAPNGFGLDNRGSRNDTPRRDPEMYNHYCEVSQYFGPPPNRFI